MLILSASYLKKNVNVLLVINSWLFLIEQAFILRGMFAEMQLRLSFYPQGDLFVFGSSVFLLFFLYS